MLDGLALNYFLGWKVTTRYGAIVALLLGAFLAVIVASLICAHYETTATKRQATGGRVREP